MKFHELPTETTQDIAHQVETLLNAFSNGGWLGRTPLPKGLGIFESCQEDILDLPEHWAEKLREEESDNIEQWRRPQVTWYHQLRTTREVFGFARSIKQDSTEGGGHRVIEVVPSAVAEEFQKAIELIDAEPSESQPSKGEPTAFLLYVPRYAFYGLSTHTEDAEGAKSKISLAYPFFRKQHQSERKLGREPLICLLQTLPSVFGAVSSFERQDRPRDQAGESEAQGIGSAVESPHPGEVQPGDRNPRAKTVKRRQGHPARKR